MSQPLGFNNTYALGLKEVLRPRAEAGEDFRSGPPGARGPANWPSAMNSCTGPTAGRGCKSDVSACRIRRRRWTTTWPIAGFSRGVDRRDRSVFDRCRNPVLQAKGAGGRSRLFPPVPLRAPLSRRSCQPSAGRPANRLLQLEGKIDNAAMIDMNARVQDRSRRSSESRGRFSERASWAWRFPSPRGCRACYG